MSGGMSPVVVGVDGSPAGRGALRCAVDEARLRHAQLLVVHAVPHGDPDRVAPVADDALRLARRLAPDLAVDAVVDDRTPGPALCHLAENASLLVVASRGHGGFAGLLLGSVSSYVAAHATCPVLVVHDAERRAEPVPADSRPVVVGVGPYGALRPDTDPVLDFAFTEALLRRTSLLAVRAWTPPAPPWRSDVRPLVADVAELETAERVDLTAILRPWRRIRPDVSVRQWLSPTGVAAALVDAAGQGQLVVVGVHRARAAGMRLGSVSQQVLHHAPGAVAVVHVVAGGSAHIDP